MAITAFGETLVHPLGVRSAVAIGTGRHVTMLLWMATGASDIAMTGRGSCQDLSHLLVTGCAVHGRGGVGIGKGRRHVRLMTEATIGFNHGWGVRGVARSAESLGAMPPYVAGGASQLAVPTWLFLQLFALQGMAGETGIPDLSLQFNVHRCMGIMTAAATGELIMSAAHVAKTAGGDILLLLRAVPFVTGLAGDRRLVRHALLGNGQSLPHMALFAVGIAQLRRPPGCRESHAEAGREQKTERNGQPESAVLHDFPPSNNGHVFTFSNL
jgi:hypothetical protein